MTSREQTLDSLRSNPRVPVLILGGGVNGTGLFRELALQGVDCLLVDKADYVSGASSKSSRMIHGGLRYLENREFRLVRESLFERNRLLENAAHYVTPLKTTIPLFSWLGGLVRSTLVFLGLPVRPGGRGAVIVKFGLSFYDFITRRNRRTPRHYLTSKRKSLQTLPGLNPNIVATATYWDAQISQAERLCIEMIQDACAANPNCRALNYVRPEKAEGGAITLRDEVTGQRITVQPSIVANATGAWVDFTNAALGVKTRFIGGTKGSHLVVDNQELHNALGDRMVYYEHRDGRICIVFPFGDKVLMGSTDIRIEDPDTVRCDEAEIEYMLTTLRGIFPDVAIRREEIVYTFCGVRPLPASEEGYTSKVSRGHSIRVIEPDATPPSPFVIRHSSFVPSPSVIRHSSFVIPACPFPIFCLIGGKWTTFRAFAEQVADQILPRLGLERRCSTEHTPIGGGKGFPLSPSPLVPTLPRGDDSSGRSGVHRSPRSQAPLGNASLGPPPGVETREQWIERVAAKSGLSLGRVATLLDRYGTTAEAYASPSPLVPTLLPPPLVPTLPRGDDSAGRSGVPLPRDETPLKSLPDYTVGEIARIAATEQVVHLADLVCRRSTLAILGRASDGALRELAGIVGCVLNWDDARKEEEVRRAKQT